jgi:hypothetical protein
MQVRAQIHRQNRRNFGLARVRHWQPRPDHAQRLALSGCDNARQGAHLGHTPGDYVPGSAHVKVFLITMRGHFTARKGGGVWRPLTLRDGYHPELMAASW